MKTSCENLDGYKKLDYIAIWFYKGSQYIARSNAKLAFVSTNSICQGEQVELLWQHIFDAKIEIQFCYTSFKWANNAKHAAGVTCIIVALANASKAEKRIFSGSVSKVVPHINAYLAEGSDVIIGKRSKPISNIPSMIRGNIPYDDGNFLFEAAEYTDLMKTNPELRPFIKRYGGAYEMLNSK